MHSRSKRIGVILLFIVICIGIYFTCVIRWNLSESLPHKMYFGTSIKLQHKVGDIITFDHPKFPVPLAKIIVGMPGDTIAIKNNRVYVGGIERGSILRLHHSYAPIASQIIPDGYVYVWAPHPKSLDSRYQMLGLVKQSDILETLWPIY